MMGDPHIGFIIAAYAVAAATLAEGLARDRYLAGVATQLARQLADSRFNVDSLGVVKMLEPIAISACGPSPAFGDAAFTGTLWRAAR